MFEIEFENKEGKKELVWQTSWGFTTRSIGVMVMIHGDDKGLVLPPKVARFQVVIIPIIYKSSDKTGMMAMVDELHAQLKKQGIRSHVDDRDTYRPGWKYNDWELKGVPLRIEFGPKDFEKG